MIEKSVGSNLLYEIRIGTHIDSGWYERFEGMEFIYLENGDTLLRGPIVDQSALHGILTRIQDLNLTLIHIKKIS